jgi:hypothetical protein
MNEFVNRVFKIFLLVLFGCLAIFGFVRSIQGTITEQGASDFHAYWYAGTFIREGINPYKASQEGWIISHPITFIDGTMETNIAFKGGSTVPANTAPLVLLLYPLSFFTWVTAKTIWLVINICLGIATPILLIKILPLVKKSDQWLLAFMFWGLLATRAAIGPGQTTLIIFFLMLVALLFKEYWAVAGVALGLALSKYSLAFPVFLLFCFQKKWRACIVSVVVQLVGIGLMSLITLTSPWEIYKEYYHMLIVHADQGGINIAAYFGQDLIINIFLFIATIALGVLICFKSSSIRSKNFYPQVSVILILWFLLAVYHKQYDALVFILFISFVLFGINNKIWNMSSCWYKILLWVTILLTAFESIPGTTFLEKLLPGSSAAILWADATNWITTFSIFGSCAFLMLMINRLKSDSRYS